jgi:Listeria-Bacteroides repeat domain (List_Bact_rpt).
MQVLQSNTYTVTFDTNGSANTYANDIVDHGNTTSNPGTPEKDGYRFMGWTLNGVAYDFGQAVTSDITLVASYEKEWNVTFNTNGGTSVSSLKVLDGETISEPTTTRTDYVITGWYTDGRI